MHCSGCPLPADSVTFITGLENNQPATETNFEAGDYEPSTVNLDSKLCTNSFYLKYQQGDIFYSIGEINVLICFSFP